MRELSEKKEEEETQATNAKTVELQDQLEKSLREMEDMKAARQRQAEMVENLTYSNRTNAEATFSLRKMMQRFLKII